MLSDRFWRRIGGHADVIGRTVTLNADAALHRRCHAGHCLGRVMDRDGERRRIPLAHSPSSSAPPARITIWGVARLKRDVELAQAQAEMDAISARLAAVSQIRRIWLGSEGHPDAGGHRRQ